MFFVSVDLHLEKEITHCTVERKQDAFGCDMCNSSLKMLLKQLPDFINEKTLLRHSTNEIDVLVDLTPKSHPKIAREGIEHAWAYTKNLCRRKELLDKEARDDS